MDQPACVVPGENAIFRFKVQVTKPVRHPSTMLSAKVPHSTSSTDSVGSVI